MGLRSEIVDRVLHLPPAQTRDVVVQKGLHIPMPDGAYLLADHYAPAASSREPVVLLRSPYGRASFVGLAARAIAERGAQVLAVSCRGTFGSTGDWLPMRDEEPDGLNCVRWIEQQPWFGATITLAGPSYLGYTQWAIAAQGRESVVAMVPHITSSRLTLPFIRPDALDWDLTVRWNYLLSLQERPTAVLRSLLRLDEKKLQKAMMILPRDAADKELSGQRWQFFQDTLHHDSTDPHWTRVDHSDKVKDVKIPASFVGGWYDIFLPDQLRDYAHFTGPKRLTIGPWVHGTPAGLGAAVAETVGFALRTANGAMPADRAEVRVYVMGTGDKGSAAPGLSPKPPAPWRDFGSWPPPGYEQVRLHLEGGGTLTPAPVGSDEEFSQYRYDPTDPTPSAGGPLLSVGAGPVDNRDLEARTDVLLFTTAALNADVEVIGEISAEIWMSSSAANTDVFVRLCDVDERGTSTNICDGIVGMPMNSADPKGVRRAVVALWPTAYRFRAGHRIRVQVSSGAHPRYARNTGGSGSRADGTECLIADQRIFHDRVRPSALMLPIATGHQLPT